MNLFTEIRGRVLDALAAMEAAGELPPGLDTANVAVEPPRDGAHGDMATNAAMVLARPAAMKPRDIAGLLGARLGADERIASAEVAGPGFLNLRLAPAVWHGVIRTALGEGADFGRSGMGAGRTVNVEFVSANPTGPLHVGHTRGAVFGDALASLLAFAGHEVTREYYINDGGAQVDVLARSVYLRYLEAHGQAVAFEDGTYPGDYLKPVGEALMREVGAAFVDQPEAVWLAEVRSFATDAMMDLIRDDLRALGVEMDRFFSEKSLYGTGRIEEALATLEEKGLIYEGVLEPPKGKVPDDWEPRRQTLFKSTAHGDDVDRPVKKSDGGWTYFAPDIAYHYDKVMRGYDALIDVFGADHGGYVKRMKAAVSALSDATVPLDIRLTQLVKLWKNGEPFKMSKRAGTFVTLRDVVDQVGPDVTRFVMLTRKNDAPLDFGAPVTTPVEHWPGRRVTGVEPHPLGRLVLVYTGLSGHHKGAAQAARNIWRSRLDDETFARFIAVRPPAPEGELDGGKWEHAMRHHGLPALAARRAKLRAEEAEEFEKNGLDRKTARHRAQGVLRLRPAWAVLDQHGVVRAAGARLNPWNANPAINLLRRLRGY